MALQNKKNKWLIYLAIFFLVNILLSSYFLDIWPTPNCVSRALPVLTFSEDKTLKIDKYADLSIDKSKVGSHFYSDKAPLPTLCMIPLYELIKLCGHDKVSNDTARKYPIYFAYRIGILYSGDYRFPELIPISIMGGLLFGSLPFVLIVLMSFIALHKMKPSISPVLMAMLAWYGSFIFVFSGTFFNHVFAGFLLLLSFILLKKTNYFLSGLALGFGFLTEYTVIVASPFWFICIWMKEKKFRDSLIFALGTFPSILFIALYNWLITGSPWKMLNAYHVTFQELQHHYGFSLPSLKAIWGLSFSGWMGLFNFAPVLYCIAFYIILTLIACIKSQSKLWKQIPQQAVGYYTLRFAGLFNLPIPLRNAFGIGVSLIKNKKFTLPPETICLAGFGIVFFLLISSFFTWWGGWSYGPRYLIVLAVLLLYEGMLRISRNKINRFLFTATALFGIAGAWLAKATVVYMVPFPAYEGFFNPYLHVLLPDLFAGRVNANNALTAFFNIDPQIGVYGWLLLYCISLCGLSLLYKKWFAAPSIIQ